jgi:hypothetical protein
MRLLKLERNGRFSLTQFSGNNIPQYAILSHTWERNDQELTYHDLVNGLGSEKIGYRKIQFCAEQARKDELQYFWVDSCCTIQAHHRRQCPTKRVACAAENGGRMHIAFQYECIDIYYPLPFHL